MLGYDIKKFVEILEKIKNTYSSLNEMARKSSITSSYLSKIMAFKYQEPPSPKVLKNIAENSHNIVSYMDLMFICGYINNHNIFEYYNKTFSTEKVYKVMQKNKILNDNEINTFSTNNFYKKIKELPQEKQRTFFTEFDKNNNEIYKNTLKSVNENLIEDINKIPIVEDFNEDMIAIKNKKLRFISNKENIKHFAFFSNDYIKKEYDYICVKAKDNSMNLKINKQDTILIQLQDSLKHGDIGFFIVDNKQVLRRYINNNEYICLEALSKYEDYIPSIYNTKIDKIKILGKVIAYQGKI